MSTTETEKRKPIRMGEIALAMATRPHAEPTTDVEVNRSTTNGRWGFKVSVSARDADEAYAKAKELALQAEKDFPYIETPKGVGPTTKTKGPSNKVPF
jgi:hypothetical protein